MGPGKKMIISTVIVELIIITLLVFYFFLFVHCSSSVFEPANFSMARLHASPDAPSTPFFWFLNQSLIIFLLFWRIILFLEYGNTHNHHLFSYVTTDNLLESLTVHRLLEVGLFFTVAICLGCYWPFVWLS